MEEFNSTVQYLDNLLNINSDYFKQMVNSVNPKELL